MSKAIFFCEDDESINMLLNETFRKAGFEAEGFLEPVSFLKRLENKVPNLIMLDLMLPFMSGYDVLKKLKENDSTKDVPVIILSAKFKEEDIVKGLDMGASDYITKPFGVAELVARVKANLRKVSDSENKLYRLRDFTLDSKEYKLYYKTTEIPIRIKEYELLKYLLDNLGRVVSRQELFKEVWGESCMVETRTIDVHITSLRKKILTFTDEPYIETIRGVGYVIK